MMNYYNEILYYIQKLTGDRHLAQDLAQETYVKVLAQNKNSEKILQKAYFYKVAKNLVIDKARKDKIFTQIPYDEKEHISKCEDVKNLILDEFRKDKLKECIQGLSSQNKRAFVLHFYQGYTRKEISEIMKISVNAVEKNITRAVLKLKEKMKKYD